MYVKEIIHAIGLNHIYEYCIVDDLYRVVQYSEGVLAYCDEVERGVDKVGLFDIVPELIGMEAELDRLWKGKQKRVEIPQVFKSPDTYVNISVHADMDQQRLIVLFENITERTKSQQFAAQVHNENLLLLKEIEEKNRQLRLFNEEMQRLVEEEVRKNRQKQHMLELQTRHAQMGELIALITHQWKQPLSVIQTIATRLKMKSAMGKLDDKLFTEKIDHLIKQANYLTQTVHDFQKFFTPSKARSKFVVKKTIESVLDLVKMDYALSNIEVTLEGDEHISAEGYPNEYNQVILSLLQNAKEAFASQRKEKKWIRIAVGEKEGRSLVRISDNAGGIQKEQLEEIFTQYMTTKENGSGLGLYIAKSVIEENMHGKLWVENSSVGADFYILL